MQTFQIYWFSGTGNTLVAARTLADKLENSGGRVELFSMAAKPVNPSDGSTLIFCWPVYFYGMPRLVSNFVGALPRGSNPVYMVCTMGGHAGGNQATAGQIFSSQGFDVMGGLDLLMPNNYIGGRIPSSTSTEKLITDANQKLHEFAQLIVKGERLKVSGSMMSKLISRAGSLAFGVDLSLSRKSFRVTDTCTGCEICARTCPVENIIMVENRPAWGKGCQQCLRCLHICPEAAIDFRGAMKRGRPQYIAPGVTVNDFMER